MTYTTPEDKRILLDLEALKADMPGLSGLHNVSPIFLVSFTMSPFLALYGPIIGVPGGIAIFLLIPLAMVAYLRFSTYRWRDPLALERLKIISFSSRTVYPGAFFWLALTSVPRIWLLIVPIMWLTSEAVALYKSRIVSDRHVISTYRGSFSTDKNGDIIFDAKKDRSRRYFESQSRGFWLKVMEFYPAVMLIILGPMLYLRSQMLRDNFEPRFFIAFVFAVFLATAFRAIITEFDVTKRAIKLKAAGAF